MASERQRLAALVIGRTVAAPAGSLSFPPYESSRWTDADGRHVVDVWLSDGGKLASVEWHGTDQEILSLRIVAGNTAAWQKVVSHLDAAGGKAPSSNGGGGNHRSIIEGVVELGTALGFLSEPEFSHQRFVYDAIWRKLAGGAPSHAFEVQVSGNLSDAMARLKHATSIWNSRPYLVTTDEHRERAQWMLSGAFHEMAGTLRILEPGDVFRLLALRRQVALLEAPFR